MALEVKVVEYSDYLHYAVSGILESSECSTDTFLELIAYCQSSGISNVLLDIRDIIGTINCTDKMGYFFKVTELHGGYLKFGGIPIRIALLGEVDFSSEGRSVQKFAAGRGFATLITSDLKAALGWLREPVSLAAWTVR